MNALRTVLLVCVTLVAFLVLTDRALARQGTGFDGKVWRQVPSFPVAAYQFDPVEYKGVIYVAGGYTGSGALNSVYLAHVLPDGSLGEWTAGPSLPETAQGPGAAACNGRLFVSSDDHNHLFSAAIAPDGTLGSWQSETFPGGPAGGPEGGRLMLRANAGKLYAFGGWNNGGGMYAEVSFATVADNGTLGTWQTTTSMPQTRQHASVQFVNGRVYVIGGIGFPILSSVISASVACDGSLGAWRTETSLDSPRWMQNSLLIDGQIFLFGGRTDYDDFGGIWGIYRGVIDPSDGRITSWDLAGSVPEEFNEAPGLAYSRSTKTAYYIGGRQTGTGLFTNHVFRTTVCPADYNGDGFMDGMDYDQFMNDFETGCP